MTRDYLVTILKALIKLTCNGVAPYLRPPEVEEGTVYANFRTHLRKILTDLNGMRYQSRPRIILHRDHSQPYDV